MEGGLPNFNLDECEDFCGKREDCNLYQFSRERQECKLMGEGTPANSTNFEHFASCAKGTLSFYQTCDTIGIYYDFLKALNIQRNHISKLDVCKTTGGPSPHQKCIFPFRFGGKKYEKCTNDGEVGDFWCATEVDNSTNEMLLGKFGICHHEKCEKHGKITTIEYLDIKVFC